MSHTPGPWKVVGRFVYPDGEFRRNPGIPIVAHDGIAVPSDASLIAAAPTLLEAATLVDLMFQRQNLPNSGTFLGDDEHEAWTATRAAIKAARS